MGDDGAAEKVLLVQPCDRDEVAGSDAGSDSDEIVFAQAAEIYARFEVDEAATPPLQGQSRNSTLCCVSVTMLTAVVLGAVGLAGKSHVWKYMMMNAAVGGEMGQMVADANTGVDPCVDSWRYACGNYAASASQPRTRLRDLQQKVNGEVLAMAQAGPGPTVWGWQHFLRECTAEVEGTDLAAGQSIKWRLERGLPAAGVVYGRSRSNDSDNQKRVATITDLVSPGPCDQTYVCSGTNLTNLVSLDEPMCIASSDPEAMCTRLIRAERVQLSTDAPAAQTSIEWCVEEATTLWPSAISAAYEARRYPPLFEGAAVEVFEAMQAQVASRLTQQRQKALATKVTSISLRTRHNSPPEKYVFDETQPHDIYGRWADARRQYHEADMALRVYTINQWEVPSTKIGVFHDPIFNEIHLPAATAANLWSPDFITRVAKLGYVLAFELGKSIYATDAIPAETRSAFEASWDCYTDQHSVPEPVVRVAMHHRLAASAVAATVGSAATDQRLICNPDCVVSTAAGRAYTMMVQTWCEAVPSVQSTVIALTVNQTSAIGQAWQCPANPPELVCTTLGA
jgi:hypothetical protein